MKVIIDETLSGKELIDFVVKNKSQLFAQKKAIPKQCDVIEGLPSLYNVGAKEVTKTVIGAISDDATTVRAKFVGNTAYWMDSQKDVLLPDCWERSIKAGKGRIHLKDHTYKLDAVIGDIVNVYSQQLSLAEFGINKAGTTQALIFESDVKKEYDERTFKRYKTGKINQHSIGLSYVGLDVAVNDEDYKEEFALWNKVFPKVINQEDATKSGYFFVVSEIKLIEVSAVILGANELTPTLEVKLFDDTYQDPSEKDTSDKSFNIIEAIQKTNFLI